LHGIFQRLHLSSRNQILKLQHMKKYILTIVLATVAMTASVAQEKTAPRTEFTVELSTSSLEVKAGEIKELTLTLNRSKQYSKSKATLGLSSGLPQGVTVTFEPTDGVLESSVVKVAVAEHAKAGNYMIILNSTMQHKSKGATLKLVVTEGTGEAVSKN
jgi:hypothetical protein